MTTITSKFTKERLIDWAVVAVAERGRDLKDAPESVEAAANLKLAEIALAALTAEPVRYLNKFSGTCVTLEQQSNAADDVAVYIPLYAAQPVPVVSFYRDGIEAAASWVDKQRQAFDNEHGRYDSDTGAFEFGNDAQHDWSYALAELADGIRGLHPNAGGNSPVIPDGWKLAPEKADEDMIAEGNIMASCMIETVGKIDVSLIYGAMLAAAPEKETGPCTK